MNVNEKCTNSTSITKWHFRTIGMGTFNYRLAAKRLAQDAMSTSLFESSIGYDEKIFLNHLPDFWDQHKQVLSARVPGFGWWIWKPHFIRYCLSEIPKDEGLLYLDAGTVISKSKEDLQNLGRILELGRDTTLIGSNSQNFSENLYTSKALLDYLDIKEEDRLSNQYWAGFLLVRNNNSGESFVNCWANLVCKSNHSFLLPDIIKEQEVKGFVHHMHDQAVFSSLMKSFGAKSVEIDQDNNYGAIRPIRHRYAFSYYETRLYIILLYKTIFMISRFKLYVLRRLYRDSLSKKPINHG